MESETEQLCGWEGNHRPGG